ncbi:MAG TPA: metallophosphoesterase, partial [Herpetosiphonaceae bacterium]|nr:metallophosphoesterase [Herpetosiphonaceae bacterium]
MLFRTVIALSFTLSTLIFGAMPSPVYAADPVLVGAGDIGNCGTDSDEATARLLDEISGTVFTTGDNVYPDGTASQFARCYDPNWGRHKERTRPTPGNHDYHTSGASAYFDYFGAAAGRRGEGYYSYDLGAWHIIALNSNISMSAGSAQMEWLQADLQANPADCTLAYWHHPRFSSGDHGSSSMPRAAWETLYEAGADVVLNGHDHNYERFAPQTPSGALDRTRGIRQFVVGTGGTDLRDVGSPIANSEARNDTTHGVLKLTLRATSYDWEFVPVAGRTYEDAGSGSCSGATDAPTRTITPTRNMPTATVPRTATRTPTNAPSETATRTSTATPVETATGTPTTPPDNTPVPEGCETSSEEWESRSFEPQYGTFTAEFDATPHRPRMDGVTGLAAGSADEYDDLAAIVRFNPDGLIDARDGPAYRAVAPIPYTAGTSYRFRMVVRVPEHTYDIFVTPAGGTEQEVGTNFAFRTEQAEVTSLSNWAVYREHGTHTVCDFTIAPVPPATATPVPEGCETSSEEWESRSFEPQYGTFTAEFDATPHKANMDGVTGLAAGSATEYDDLAAIVRFNPDGFIDARNGSAYRAIAPIPYTVETSYRFRLVVRVAEHTYDIFVTPADGSEQEVGTNFAFRTEQAEVPSVSNWAVYREHGRHTVCDFAILPALPATPTPTTEWTNRLRNAGFELDRDESGRPDNWTTNRRATRSDRDVHGGSYAMQHSATDDKNYKIRQTVNHVRGEQLYTF